MSVGDIGTCGDANPLVGDDGAEGPLIWGFGPCEEV